MTDVFRKEDFEVQADDEFEYTAEQAATVANAVLEERTKCSSHANNGKHSAEFLTMSMVAETADAGWRCCLCRKKLLLVAAE